jgi:DNA-binding GntR family transcriptional regulator
LVKPLYEANSGGLKRPKHLSLVDIAYQSLVEAIVNQVFAPGTPINIDMLARELNMSNTPMREALMRMTGEGFIEQRANKGFVVTNLLTQEQLRHLFTVRLLLETHALSTGKITATDIEELDMLAQQMQTAGDGLVYQDFRGFLQNDHLLHHKIVSLSENEFLVNAWENLNVHLHLSRLYTGIGLFDRNHSTVEHIDVVRALQANDREQAVSLLSKHIRDVETRLVAFLTSLNTSEDSKA